MGVWSEYCSCSHKHVVVTLGDAPPAVAELVRQHAGLELSDAVQGGGEGELCGNKGSSSGGGCGISVGRLLGTFSDASQIYGYLTERYMERWTAFFRWLHDKLDEDDRRKPLWILFYCSDADLFFSLLWDDKRSAVTVRTAPLLTRHLPLLSR